MRAAEPPPGSVFARLAGGGALRRHLPTERGLDRRSAECTGYRRPRLTRDDALSEQDPAEARERVARLGGEQG
ncbi:hypothetical protein [Umezawaea beigongshangensis]|uniref:hypothetical protein n=1 Tax=Umezawaea beigongshangensis TaxID=2780383 RepID=UPI0018F26779|nr:hypothetical protein [Umezawaea beigongshangensis]